MNYNPLFDSTNVDTPSGMNSAVAASAITHVPSQGTGLAGEVYITNGWIGNTTTLKTIIANNAPVSTFTSTQVKYSGTNSATTVGEFLGDDAASIQGVPGDIFEMGPSGIKLTGYIYIPAGVHEIAVTSDDGFEMTIGGVNFTEFTGTRGADETGRVSDFAGGLYEIEIIYFDAGGRQELELEIDGMTVDSSAFYQSVSDFTDPPAGVPLVPVADYHPSYFINDALDVATTDTGSVGIDNIQGGGADEVLKGLASDDVIHGGYGDDKLEGSDGDDVLDGGRGSDLLIGGKGDDLLISRSDVGEQRIGQLAIGAPTRGDPDGEVNNARQKLRGYEDQPLIGDDVMFGGEGRDTFLIQPLLNAKLEIIQKHTRHDGSINWAGVAGENNELHDHWTDAFGIEVIGDYVKGEDQIAVIGHTATVTSIDYRDVDGDGHDESIINVYSNQHGGGGAHTQDYLGQIIVFGDIVLQDDIITNSGVTFGIIENYTDIEEAIFPFGGTKVTSVNGQTIYGYDTRDANGNLGPITGSPENFIDNDFYHDAAAHGLTFGDPMAPGAELTRGPFAPLPIVAGTGVSQTGTSGADIMGQASPAAPTGLPGALSFFDFRETGTLDGTYEDARGGPSFKTFTQDENRAYLRTDAITTGPDGVTANAIEFNGTDEFAFADHHNALNVTQGTIALWIRPDDLSRDRTFLSKDESGTDKGGHIRLGHTDNGGLFMRFAVGDGRWGSQSWETSAPLLTEGAWQHVAVNFTADGVVVYLNGVAVSDSAWTKVEGSVATPGAMTEAYLVQNEEPWVLGADSYRAEANDTAQVFATTDAKLQRAFDGAIAEFGMWGGYAPDDALTPAEINNLMTYGPGTALTNPAGPQPMIAADDTFDGAGGNDIIDGGAGNDTLEGGAGHDSIKGGYGDDSIDGGSGNDTLDGGRGNDLVIGGAGDDLLIARSDAGEQRAGQLVLDAPSRPYPDASIDPQYLKLVDWVDHPHAADDVLVGGAGADHFLIQPLINAKKDIILKHINDDRSINWHGVAGENRRIHDHWVDLFGIDIIADYEAGIDTISVIGHTANILDVTYKAIDTDGDGKMDDAVSVITVYSQQGNNGGAHDEDILGYVVVHGDLVDEDDIVTNAGAHHGIVETVDDLLEAVAPTGTTKISTAPDGTEIFGYDSRDIDGDPLANDPEAFSSNPFLASGDISFSSSIGDLPATAVIAASSGGVFNGTNDAIEILHTASQEQAEGSWAFSFKADNPSLGRDQVLLSKDHSGYKDGGHLSIYLTGNGRLKVRFQSENESRYLVDWGREVQADQLHHVVFTFTTDTIALYLDGEMIDADDGFPAGMLGNTESTFLGASTRQRVDDDDRLQDFFDGEITNVSAFDRALDPVEVVILTDAEGDNLSVAPPTEIYGDDQANSLVGSHVSEIIMGMGGDDSISASGGKDTIDGGTGIDTISGGGGDDHLDVGDGDASGVQSASGGDGNDTYIYRKSSSNVQLAMAGGESADSGSDDKVVFEDLNLSDVLFSVQSNSLQLDWNDPTNSGFVLIGDSGQHIEKYEFADGSTLEKIFRAPGHAVFTAMGGDGNEKIHGKDLGRIFAGDGNDDISGAGQLFGQDGDDTYRVSRSGTEGVIAYETSGTDKVIFEDLNLSDLDFSTVNHPWSELGEALQVGWSNLAGGRETLLIADLASDIESYEFADGSTFAKIYRAPGHTAFTAIGGDEDETIHGKDLGRIFAGDGNDDISGAGQLFGQNGDDIYRINRAGTEAVIAYETGGTDKVVFEDLNLSDLDFSTVNHPWSELGEALQIGWSNLAGSRETLLIADLANDIESFEFADGSSVAQLYRAHGHVSFTAVGTGGDEKIHGKDLGRIFAGDGNDDISGAGQLFGQDGDDVYRIGRDGVEGVIAYETGGTDMVVFEDLDLSDLDFSSVNHPWAGLGQAMQIGWTSPAGTRETLLIADMANGIEGFEFADGSAASMIYRAPGHNSFTAMGTDEGEKIHGKDLGQIFAGDGNDDISGASQLFGQGGDDIYRIGQAGVENVIAYETGGVDKVVFEDLNLAEVDFSIVDHPWGELAQALQVGWTSATGARETLLIADMASDIESFEFADGSVLSSVGIPSHWSAANNLFSVNGTSGDNIIHAGRSVHQIYGGAGNDDIGGAHYLYGQDGDDTYRVTRDGAVGVIHYDTSGNDTVIFDDIALSEVSFAIIDTADGHWLGDYISISWTRDDGVTDSVQISEGTDIEHFEFGDGSILTQSDINLLI